MNPSPHLKQPSIPTALKPRLRVYEIDGVTFVVARLPDASEDGPHLPSADQRIRIGADDI